MKISGRLIQILILAGIITYLVYDKLFDKEVVYVDTIVLVEEYHMKQELTSKMQRAFDIKKGLYDSLKTYFVVDTANMDVRRQLFDLEEQLSELEEQYNQLNVTVWNRINPLLAQFGAENGYDIIVGANGMGTVLYGKPDKDITQEVLAYINKEYEDQ